MSVREMDAECTGWADDDEDGGIPSDRDKAALEISGLMFSLPAAV